MKAKMKGKLNEFGNLSIERAGKLKLQLCPGGEGEASAACGDWCPLFLEPKNLQVAKSQEKWVLDLCMNTVIFDEFIDERKEDA